MVTPLGKPVFTIEIDPIQFNKFTDQQFFTNNILKVDCPSCIAKAAELLLLPGRYGYAMAAPSAGTRRSQRGGRGGGRHNHQQPGAQRYVHVRQLG